MEPSEFGLLTAQPSWNKRVNSHIGAAATLDGDAELMLRVQAGDEGSFQVLLDRYRIPLIRFLYRMVQNQAVAEELGQEVFLRVFRSRLTYQPLAKFTTWLFRIGSHLALNHIRDGRRGGSNARWLASLGSQRNEAVAEDLRDETRTVEQELLYQVRLKEVRQAVNGLPGKQRAAVLMHKYEEMEYSQIAGVFGCSESAVKSLLFRAYESLRARLAHMA